VEVYGGLSELNSYRRNYRKYIFIVCKSLLRLLVGGEGGGGDYLTRQQ